jgi:hypothetical protein
LSSASPLALSAPSWPIAASTDCCEREEMTTFAPSSTSAFAAAYPSAASHHPSYSAVA